MEKVLKIKQKSMYYIKVFKDYKIIKFFIVNLQQS